MDAALTAFGRGAVTCGGFVVGAAVYGLGFGLIARQAGMSAHDAVLMSATVYAGSAQFMAVQVWSLPNLVMAAALVSFAMNSRYLLMGASLRPRLDGVPAWQVYPALALLGDGNWAETLKYSSTARANWAFLLGGGVAMYVAWVGSTAMGYAAGQLLGEPTRLALDFLLPAFLLSLLVALWGGRGSVLPAATAGAVSIAMSLFSDGPWGVVGGGLAGGGVAAFRASRPGDRDGDA